MTNTLLSRCPFRTYSARRLNRRRRTLRIEGLEDRAVPATFHVSLTGNDITGNGSIATPFRTVQAGINAAAAVSDGADVVKVEAGTYATALVDLNLTIPSSANLLDLQLLGGFDVGSNFTTRTARSTVYAPQSVGDVNNIDVDSFDANTTIDGFHFVFDGNGVGGTGGTRLSGGVMSRNSGFVFNNNTVEVGLGRVGAGARSTGVASLPGTDQTGLTITNNTIQADAGLGAFNDFAHAIFLNPDSIRTTDVVISGNLITGTTLANGIVVDTNGHVNITGNTIVRTGSGSVFFLALIGLRARSVVPALDDVLISENTLDSAGRANSIAIHFADAGGTQPISGILVEKNLIQNSTTGVVIGPGANQNNAISATLNFNSFDGNTTAMLRSSLAAGSTNINATANWWGSVTGPNTAANPGGLGQSIDDTTGSFDSTGISFRPWLVYAPDNNPALPGVQLKTLVTVTAGNDVSVAENDFTLLQNAVGAVTDGQTLNLSGDFDWTATNAAAAYTNSTNTSAIADIRGVELPGGVDNVTITSSAEDAHILGRGDFEDLVFDAFLFADDGPSVGNSNFILEKLDIDDFEAGVVFGWNGTGTFQGTKIRDNTITVGGDNFDLQNIAIYFAAGANQQITGNTVEFQGDGTRVIGTGARSFGFQNNTTGGALYDGLLIDNNTFQLLASSTGVEIVHGIWENGHNDDNTADISITSNFFLGRQGVDDFDRALFLTSQTDGLVIDGNTFTDVDNILFSRNAAGGVEPGDEFTFTNNILTRVGGADGIFLRNVTDDALPITVVVHWNINNTIDGFTGVRGLNELSTQATGASRPLSAASDINAVIAEGAVTDAFVDDNWGAAGRFTDPDGIGTGFGPIAFSFNTFNTIQQGVDAASAGSMVGVFAGTYAENVTIAKSLTLAGVGPATILSAGGGIGIDASSLGGDIAIMDLTIQGANSAVEATDLDSFTMSNVNLSGNTTGGTISNVTTVNVSTDAVATNQTVEISATQFEIVGQGTFTYANVDTMSITTGAGDDTFDVSTALTTNFMLDAGANTPVGDTLTIVPLALPQVTFVNFENAIGITPSKVVATLSRGVLTLTGDDANNVIRLAQVGTDITVTGTNTIIEGGPTFIGVTSIKTVMKGGDDVITINPLTPFSLAGAATFDLGDGSNTLSLITTGLLSLGSLTVKAGDGGDQVAISGAATSTVTGNASLNLGAGGTDVTLNSLQVLGGGGLKVNATDGDDTLNLTAVQVTRAINASTGNGSLTVNSTGGTYGSMSLTAGGKTPADPSQGVALDVDTTTVTKALKLSSKAGAQFNMNGGTMGSVSVTAGKLGTAEVNLSGSPTVNGGFTVKGAVTEFNVVAGTPTINGNLKVTGTTNTLARMFPTSVVNIGGSVSAQGGSGAMSFIVEGTSLTVAKTLTVKSQSNTLIQLTPTAASQITGNVSLTSGVEDDVMTINSNVGFVGHLTISAGAGNNDITLGSNTANLAITRNLSVTTLGGDDVIRLNRTAVTGTTKVKSGAGSDLLDITGPATFTGSTTIDLGAGDDQWSVANNVGTTTGPVTFTGKVNAKLGAGNDTLILGLLPAFGGNANTLVAFAAPSGNKVDGGTGLNLFDTGTAQTTGTFATANF